MTGPEVIRRHADETAEQRGGGPEAAPGVAALGKDRQHAGPVGGTAGDVEAARSSISASAASVADVTVAAVTCSQHCAAARPMSHGLGREAAWFAVNEGSGLVRRRRPSASP